jgi:2-polyprenyl-3-methyl-5-hydroxy-6-metoxy-1,4-benzoquinol methylase
LSSQVFLVCYGFLSGIDVLLSHRFTFTKNTWSHVSSIYQEYAYHSVQDGWAHSYVVPSLRRMLGTIPKVVLDLGCGNGAVARALLADGHDVYGVDASESGIAIASREAPGRFFVLDVATGKLPSQLSEKKFDAVISTEVIEHLYDPRGFLDFAKSLLPSGGALIVSAPYHGYLKNVALAVTGKLDSHFTALWDGGHIKFFSRKTLEELLRERGFLVESFVGAGRLPWLWRSMLIKAKKS